MIPFFKQFQAVVWVLNLGFFMTRTAYFMTWPFIAVILRDSFHLKSAEIGITLGTGVFIGCFVSFYAGNLSDRFGRSNIILLAILCHVIAFGGLAFSQSIILFLVFTSLIGISGALFESPARAFLTDLVPEQKLRELSLNIRYFCVNIGAVCGPLLALFFGLTAQKSAFITTGVIYSFFFIFLWIALKIIPPKIYGTYHKEMASLSNSIKVIRQDYAYLTFILAMICCLIGYAQFYTNLSLYLTESAPGTGLKTFALLIATNGLVIILFQFPLTKLLQKFQISYVLQIGSLLMGIGFLIFIFLPAHLIWAWVLTTVILSLGEVIVFPNAQIHIDRIAPPHLKGSYFGLAGFFRMGSAIGPFLGGLALDAYGGTGLFSLMVIVILVSMMIFQLSFILFRQKQKLSGILKPIV